MIYTWLDIGSDQKQRIYQTNNIIKVHSLIKHFLSIDAFPTKYSIVKLISKDFQAFQFDLAISYFHFLT